MPRLVPGFMPRFMPRVVPAIVPCPRSSASGCLGATRLDAASLDAACLDAAWPRAVSTGPAAIEVGIRQSSRKACRRGVQQVRGHPPRRHIIPVYGASAWCIRMVCGHGARPSANAYRMSARCLSSASCLRRTSSVLWASERGLVRGVREVDARVEGGAIHAEFELSRWPPCRASTSPVRTDH